MYPEKYGESRFQLKEEGNNPLVIIGVNPSTATDKILYFEKTVLEIWLRQNPIKIATQINQEARRYIMGNKSPYSKVLFSSYQEPFIDLPIQQLYYRLQH